MRSVILRRSIQIMLFLLVPEKHLTISACMFSSITLGTVLSDS